MTVWRGRGTRFAEETIQGTVAWKGFVGGVDWSVWFDHFYQAKGAANYAASLNDLVGAANLVEGNGAVPWAAGNGWQFNAALNQWLDTQLTPANDQSWSMLIQFTNVTDTGIVAGSNNGAGRRLMIRPDNGGGAVSYSNGDFVLVAPVLLTGNLGVAGAAAYRNGANEGGAIGAWGGASALTIFIGGANNGALQLPISAEIVAVGIKEGPALNAGEVAAARAQMAAL